MRIKAGPRQKRPATVWLVFYDREHVTEIRRGENEGVKLTNSNVVRKLLRVASWGRRRIEAETSPRCVEGKKPQRLRADRAGGEHGDGAWRHRLPATRQRILRAD